MVIVAYVGRACGHFAHILIFYLVGISDPASGKHNVVRGHCEATVSDLNALSVIPTVEHPALEGERRGDINHSADGYSEHRFGCCGSACGSSSFYIIYHVVGDRLPDCVEVVFLVVVVNAGSRTCGKASAAAVGLSVPFNKLKACGRGEACLVVGQQSYLRVVENCLGRLCPVGVKVIVIHDLSGVLEVGIHSGEHYVGRDDGYILTRIILVAVCVNPVREHLFLGRGERALASLRQSAVCVGVSIGNVSARTCAGVIGNGVCKSLEYCGYGLVLKQRLVYVYKRTCVCINPFENNQVVLVYPLSCALKQCCFGNERTCGNHYRSGNKAAVLNLYIKLDRE